MELQNAKVIQAYPIKKGVSASTGKEWQIFEFVVEYQSGKYPSHALLQIFGEERIKELGKFCKPNTDTLLNISFDIDARESNGRWWNSLNVWKIAEADATQSAEAPSNTPPSEITPTPKTEKKAEPTTPPTTAKPSPEPQAEGSGEGDDLPF